MSCQLQSLSTGRFPIESSNLFVKWDLEKKAMQDFRWIESERAGEDIGDFRLSWLWWSTGRIKWLESIGTGAQG